MAEAENGQEKTEDATPRRQEKARSEGQAARSRELVTCVLVAGGAVALWLWAPVGVGGLLQATRDLFATAGSQFWRLGSGELQIVAPMLWAGVFVVAVPLLASFALSILGSLGVGGLLFAPKAAAPKLSRMDPLKGLQRMFSKRTLVELFKSILKVALISGTAVLILAASLSWFQTLSYLSPASGYAAGSSLLLAALLVFGLALVLVAVIDVPFQVREHAQQLKMTRQEVKDEMKESEGRPEVRARIRRAQQALSSQRMLADVASADVIITNPEHFAVALRYDAERGAPIVIAAGSDFLALRLREVAREHEIPELRIPALARALFFNTAVGDLIPEGLYAAVAQVLAYLHNLDAFRCGQRAERPRLGSVAVPNDLRRRADGTREQDRD
ncbi:MAG: flagellar type III secretion system protein FlhB [Pseudomonadota bacterium]